MSEEEYDYKYTTAFERLGLKTDSRAIEIDLPNPQLMSHPVTKQPKDTKQPEPQAALARKTKGLLTAALLLVLLVGLVFGGIALWGKKAGTDSVSNSSNPNDPLTYDEGVVINGVKWATRNVDAPGAFAAKPEDPGMFYQWNRKKAWPATGEVTDWDTSIPTGDTWEKANDPSPAGWRVPTHDEIKKLLDTGKVNNEWTAINGINGMKFTDRTTGNSIFLLASGARYNDDGYDGGGDGAHYCYGVLSLYWSSTANNSDCAYDLSLPTSRSLGSHLRTCGFSIRSVAE